MNEFELNNLHKSLKQTCQIQVIYVRQIIKHLMCTIRQVKQSNKVTKVRKRNQTQMTQVVFKDVWNS